MRHSNSLSKIFLVLGLLQLSTALADNLPLYEIIPTARFKNTGLDNEFRAYKVDRKKNTIEVCGVVIGPGGEKKRAACGGYKNFPPINSRIVRVLVEPNQVPGGPIGPGDFWLVDVNTGVVTLCESILNVCVDLAEN